MALQVDFKGPCVIYGVTTDGHRFGGFNPQGYESTDDYRAAPNAFLFYMGTKGGDPFVCKKVGGGEAAVYDYRKGGPQFGADGLIIGAPTGPVFGGFAGPDSESGGFGELRTAKSRLGLAYAKLPAEAKSKSLFGGEKTEAKLKEVMVFFAPELAALY